MYQSTYCIVSWFGEAKEQIQSIWESLVVSVNYFRAVYKVSVNLGTRSLEFISPIAPLETAFKHTRLR